MVSKEMATKILTICSVQTLHKLYTILLERTFKLCVITELNH